ncbi:MAG: thioredoxin domain-containing protein [Fimbriimonas sp.]|nr:thioredoxin domain-containing protein [Fimbriimonas sp.]
MKESPVQAPILQIKTASFRAEVIDNPDPILIDFWAPWCGPCRAMKPNLVQAAEKLLGQVRVAQVNVDEEPAIAEAFGIKSIPTCVLIRGNAILDAYVGLVPSAVLVDKVLLKIGQTKEVTK